MRCSVVNCCSASFISSSSSCETSGLRAPPSISITPPRKLYDSDRVLCEMQKSSSFESKLKLFAHVKEDDKDVIIDALFKSGFCLDDLLPVVDVVLCYSLEELQIVALLLTKLFLSQQEGIVSLPGVVVDEGAMSQANAIEYRLKLIRALSNQYCHLEEGLLSEELCVYIKQIDPSKVGRKLFRFYVDNIASLTSSYFTCDEKDLKIRAMFLVSILQDSEVIKPLISVLRDRDLSVLARNALEQLKRCKPDVCDRVNVEIAESHYESFYFKDKVIRELLSSENVSTKQKAVDILIRDVRNSTLPYRSKSIWSRMSAATLLEAYDSDVLVNIGLELNISVYHESYYEKTKKMRRRAFAHIVQAKDLRYKVEVFHQLCHALRDRDSFISSEARKILVKTVEPMYVRMLVNKFKNETNSRDFISSAKLLKDIFNKGIVELSQKNLIARAIATKITHLIDEDSKARLNQIFHNLGSSGCSDCVIL